MIYFSIIIEVLKTNNDMITFDIVMISLDKIVIVIVIIREIRSQL